jgi:hypothetical protein
VSIAGCLSHVWHFMALQNTVVGGCD